MEMKSIYFKSSLMRVLFHFCYIEKGEISISQMGFDGIVDKALVLPKYALSSTSSGRDKIGKLNTSYVPTLQRVATIK